VGIGASAGGLEAFTQLLRALPPDTGMAFVFVQHLDPTWRDHANVVGSPNQLGRGADQLRDCPHDNQRCACLTSLSATTASTNGSSGLAIKAANPAAWR
jgi:hypothetical protein